MVDLSQTAGNVYRVSGVQEKTGVAGEAITAGSPVYLNATDGKLYDAQNDGTVAEATVVGVATAGAGRADVTIGYAPNGAKVNIGATTTAGTIYVLSAAAGAIAPAADIVTGNYVSVLFVGTGSAEVTLQIANSGVASA